MQAKKRQITFLIIYFLGAALLFSAMLQAQPQKRSIAERVKTLKDTLRLSDDQAAKITKILEDQREEMITAMNQIDKNNNDPEARRTIVQGIIKETDKKFKNVLTEEQAKKYEEMVKTRREQMGKRTRGNVKP